MGITSTAAVGNRNRCQPNHDAWTINATRDLWNKGLSASVIGERLGMTREAVLGIAFRNDFPARPPSGRFTAR